MASAAGNTWPIVETFSLVGDDVADGRKLSAYILRLTDASQKSLNQIVEESKREKSNWRDGYIEIQANGGSGILSFGGSRQIQHQISMMDTRDLGPTGQLRAIAEVNSSGGGNLVLIGTISQRMHIAATTEDTFESTKKKAKQANEELRKNAAKVLKGPTSGSSSKKALEKVSKAKGSMSVQRPMTPLNNTNRSSKPLAAKTASIIANLAKKVRKEATSSANESMDDKDDGMQRVKTKATYKPPPKRLATGSLPPDRLMAIEEPYKSVSTRDYETEYPPVHNLEERRRYKEEFDKEYPTYVGLYKRLRTVALQWQDLGDRLKSISKTDPARQQLVRDILSKFAQFETDNELKAWKMQHDELKRKLDVIKLRVHEYDNNLA